MYIEAAAPTHIQANRDAPVIQNQEYTIVRIAKKCFAAICYGTTYIFRKIIAKLVFPASSITVFTNADIQRLHNDLVTQLSQLEHAEGKCEEIPLSPGKAFRGFSITPKQPRDSKNCILFFCANTYIAEQYFETCKAIAEKSHAPVYCFSYPTTGLSDGELLHEEDLLSFGRTCITHIRTQLPEVERLTLWGHSTGASIASLLGYEYAQNKSNVAIVNDRGFLKYPRVVFAQNIPVLRSILYLAARFFGWKLYTADIANEIRCKLAVISATNDDLLEDRNRFCFALPQYIHENHFLISCDHWNQLTPKIIDRVVQFIKLK